MIPFVHKITYGASFTTESGRNRQTDEQYVHIAWEKLEFFAEFMAQEWSVQGYLE